MNWFGVVLWVSAAVVAISLPIVAWTATLRFSRLNYLGLALGTAGSGILLWFMANQRNADTARALVGAAASVLLLAVSFGSFIAIFFYRKPKNKNEHS
jgi:hypothetical protein